jgi:beta-lactamase class D
MLAEDTPAGKLSAKTGARGADSQDVALWYVGYVEKAGAVCYFALEMAPRITSPCSLSGFQKPGPFWTTSASYLRVT